MKGPSLGILNKNEGTVQNTNGKKVETLYDKVFGNK